MGGSGSRVACTNLKAQILVGGGWCILTVCWCVNSVHAGILLLVDTPCPAHDTECLVLLAGTTQNTNKTPCMCKPAGLQLLSIMQLLEQVLIIHKHHLPAVGIRGGKDFGAQARQRSGFLCDLAARRPDLIRRLVHVLQQWPRGEAIKSTLVPGACSANAHPATAGSTAGRTLVLMATCA